jgi:CBS domain containing-hemolysin-like protein
MPAVGFELFVILLLILANGVLAMAEMALVSARKARLRSEPSGVSNRCSNSMTPCQPASPSPMTGASL